MNYVDNMMQIFKRAVFKLIVVKKCTASSDDYVEKLCFIAEKLLYPIVLLFSLTILTKF